MKTNHESRLLCRDDVAAILQVTLHQAARLMNSGEFPTVRLLPNEVRVRESDLFAWIDQRKQPAAEDVKR